MSTFFTYLPTLYSTGMLPIIYNAWFFDLFIFHRDTGCGRYGSGVIDYERDTRMLVCGVERKIRMGLTLFLWGAFFCWHFKSYFLDILVLGHECIWIRLTSSKSEIFMTYSMMMIFSTSIGCLAFRNLSYEQTDDTDF